MANELSSAQTEIMEVIRNSVDDKTAAHLDGSTGFSDGEIDSIQYVKVAVKLEEAFGFEFEDDKIFGTFDTVLSMIEYVENKIRLKKVEDQVCEVLKPHLNDGGEGFDFEMAFIDSGLNSVKFVDVVVKLEESFNVTFDDDMLAFGALNNGNELVNYLDSLACDAS